MSDCNPSRTVSSSDRWTVEAKTEDEYWLCECGVARAEAGTMFKHLNEDGHIAERIDSETGLVTGFMAGGMESDKYPGGVPNSARIRREKNKNEPMFDRP